MTTNFLLPTIPEIWQKTLNWEPTIEQQQQFQQLYELILEGNSQINLTRITEPYEFWEKHLWDSLRGVMPLFPKLSVADGLRIIDIGTGAGFPGLPVAITLPNATVTLLDSVRKKIVFLQGLVREMQLENVQPVLERAEVLHQDRDYRKVYDVALVRAVGSATVCAEYTLPFLKVDGLAILYRGHWTEEEAQDLNRKLLTLGGSLECIEAFQTPLSEGVRHCLYLRKVKDLSPRKPLR